MFYYFWSQWLFKWSRWFFRGFFFYNNWFFLRNKILKTQTFFFKYTKVETRGVAFKMIEKLTWPPLISTTSLFAFLSSNCNVCIVFPPTGT